jgi:hypothetical protein
VLDIHRKFDKKSATEEVKKIMKGEAELKYQALKRRDKVAIGTIALLVLDGVGIEHTPRIRTEEGAEDDKREVQREKDMARKQLVREFELLEEELEGAMQSAAVGMPEWENVLHLATIKQL